MNNNTTEQDNLTLRNDTTTTARLLNDAIGHILSLCELSRKIENTSQLELLFDLIASTVEHGLADLLVSEDKKRYKIYSRQHPRATFQRSQNTKIQIYDDVEEAWLPVTSAYPEYQYHGAADNPIIGYTFETTKDDIYVPITEAIVYRVDLHDDIPF